MGIHDRDYMREPDPPRRSVGSIVFVILFLLLILTIAFLRQRPALFHRLTAELSRLIKIN